METQIVIVFNDKKIKLLYHIISYDVVIHFNIYTSLEVIVSRRVRLLKR